MLFLAPSRAVAGTTEAIMRTRWNLTEKSIIDFGGSAAIAKGFCVLRER